MGHEGRVGYVYFIRAANGLMKIGYTNDVGRRFEQIDGTSPVDLELFGYIKSPFARSLERKLHRILRDRRVRKEWFKLFFEDINYIKEHCDFIEARGFYYNGRYCIRKVKYTRSLGWHDRVTFDYRTMDSFASMAEEMIDENHSLIRI